MHNITPNLTISEEWTTAKCKAKGGGDTNPGLSLYFSWRDTDSCHKEALGLFFVFDLFPLKKEVQTVTSRMG